jgi:hypothetical protein
MLYIFTSYFCTTLKNKGVEDLSGWTANYENNLFSKRYAVISHFQVLQWSLCLISNSNFIEWDWSKCYCPWNINFMHFDLCSCEGFLYKTRNFYKYNWATKCRVESRRRTIPVLKIFLMFILSKLYVSPQSIVTHASHLLLQNISL